LQAQKDLKQSFTSAKASLPTVRKQQKQIRSRITENKLEKLLQVSPDVEPTPSEIIDMQEDYEPTYVRKDEVLHKSINEHKRLEQTIERRQDKINLMEDLYEDTKEEEKTLQSELKKLQLLNRRIARLKKSQKTPNMDFVVKNTKIKRYNNIECTKYASVDAMSFDPKKKPCWISRSVTYIQRHYI